MCVYSCYLPTCSRSDVFNASLVTVICRQVRRIQRTFPLLSSVIKSMWMVETVGCYQRRKLELGVLQKETFHTMKPLPKMQWRVAKRKKCKFIYFITASFCGWCNRDSVLKLVVLLVWCLILGTCRTQSMWEPAIHRGQQDVNAKK